jgi:hypothetical protein
MGGRALHYNESRILRNKIKERSKNIERFYNNKRA